MRKRLIVLGVLMAGVVICSLNPVNSKVVRIAFLVCLVSAWGGLLWLAWHRKNLRHFLLVLPWLAIIPVLLPSGRIDADELRHDYVRRMITLEGTRYVWGGESARGIDCSGLPRRALRDALLGYGVRHLNGTAMRSYVQQWWFDASAKALGDGYRNYTTPVGTTGTIKEMSYAELIPGDVAVTTNGVHILAYLGNEMWIQADPKIGRVAILNGRTADNRWFLLPVTTHRWQILRED